MSRDTDVTPEKQIQILRDLTARLVSEKLDLQRQLVELQKEKADLPVHSIAAAIARSLQSAEQTLAEEVPGTRFTVPELQTFLRGFLVEREGVIALRLPLPEEAMSAGLFSALQMTVARIPPPAVPATMPVLTPERQLVGVLENIQTAFAHWDHPAGTTAAVRVVDRTVHLLAKTPWTGNDLRDGIEKLSDAALKHATAAGSHVPAAMIRKYRSAVRTLRSPVKPAKAASRTSLAADPQPLIAAASEVLDTYRVIKSNVRKRS